MSTLNVGIFEDFVTAVIGTYAVIILKLKNK